MLILLWEGDREGPTHRSHNCWIKHILKVPGLRSREWKLEAVLVPGLQTEWLKVTESCYCLTGWRQEAWHQGVSRITGPPKGLRKHLFWPLPGSAGSQASRALDVSCPSLHLSLHDRSPLCVSGLISLGPRLFPRTPSLHLWLTLVTETVKNLPAMRKTQVWSLGQEYPLEKGTAIHSRILAWRTPRIEELCGCGPWGRRVRHDWVTDIITFSFSSLTRLHLNLITFSNKATLWASRQRRISSVATNSVRKMGLKWFMAGMTQLDSWFSLQNACLESKYISINNAFNIPNHKVRVVINIDK